MPEPDQDSKVRSLRLQQLITQEITKNDNWLSFSKFMDLALYAPELGYYVSPSEKFVEFPFVTRTLSPSRNPSSKKSIVSFKSLPS